MAERTLDEEIALTKLRGLLRPWIVTEPLNLLPDTELLVFICSENNRDLEHLPGKRLP